MHWSEIAALILGIIFAIPVLILLWVILTISWGMLVSWRSGPDPIAAKLEELDAAVRSLTLDEARAEAEAVLEKAGGVVPAVPALTAICAEVWSGAVGMSGKMMVPRPTACPART